MSALPLVVLVLSLLVASGFGLLCLVIADALREQPRVIKPKTARAPLPQLSIDALMAELNARAA